MLTVLETECQHIYTISHKLLNVFEPVWTIVHFFINLQYMTCSLKKCIKHADFIRDENNRSNMLINICFIKRRLMYGDPQDLFFKSSDIPTECDKHVKIFCAAVPYSIPVKNKICHSKKN